MSHPCSCPWPLRRWFNARFSYACALHDSLYGEKNASRRQADLFFASLIMRRGYPITALLAYWAVRVFGRSHWNKKQAEGAIQG
jgi:hypothetical protein